MTDKTHKPKKSTLNELFPDRSFKSKVESNRNKFESPKNTFERNYNRLFKEFKSTDYDSLNSHDSLDRRKIRRNKELADHSFSESLLGENYGTNPKLAIEKFIF